MHNETAEALPSFPIESPACVRPGVGFKFGPEPGTGVHFARTKDGRMHLGFSARSAESITGAR